MEKQRLNGVCKAAVFTLASSVALGIAAPVCAQATAEEATSAVNLPAGPLETSLVDLGEQLGIDIFASSNLVRGKTAPAVSGGFTPREALQRVLAGSGLEATSSEGGAFILVQEIVETDAPLSIGDGTEDRADRVDDVVVVTGSRIARTAVNAPSPIDIVTAEDIAAFGFSESTEALRFVPALNSSISLTSQEGPSGGSARGRYGLASLDLRNLGANRTLVLVNGRRHVGGVANTATVDVSSIPAALIDRVEVLTGGGSSIYGADAVSGVVNYILKDDFEGVDVRLNTSLPTRGDGEAFSGALTMGGNFDGGRGNAVFNVEYFNQTGLSANEREASRSSSFVTTNNPALSEALGINPEFRNVLLQNRRSAPIVLGPIFSLTGSSLLSPVPIVGQETPQTGGVPLQQIRDLNTGEIRSLTPVAFVSGFDTQGGDGVDGLFANPLTTLVPKSERVVVNMITDYDVTETITGFVEAKYSRNESRARGSQATITVDFPISSGNPFIPQSVQDQLSSLEAQGIPTNLNVTRFFYDDAASRPNENVRQTFRIVGGLKGELSDAFAYEVSANYGRTDTSLTNPVEPLLDRLNAASDAVVDPTTGEPICRSDIDPDTLPPISAFVPVAAPGFRSFVPGDGSCVPINLFAGFNELNPEAVDFIFQRSTEEIEIEQFVINANISGNSSDWFSLPAGSIGYAAGFEYREERSESRPDPLNLNRLGRFQTTEFTSIDGEFDVFEGFVEVNVPVLADLPLAESLAFDASVRFADYSSVGSTTSFGLGAVWQIVLDLRIRGSFNRAVRAPNIAELFAPQSVRLTDLPFLGSDPCDPNNPGEGSSTRAQNCAELVPDMASFDPSAAYFGGNVAVTTGGNLDLTEETADTFSVGFAYAPAAAPGLYVLADYYSIHIEDAVSEGINRLTIVENCADAPTIGNPFCAAVTRNPTTGAVETIQNTNLNFSAANAKGIDYQVGYAFDLDNAFGGYAGQFNIEVAGTYLIERVDQQFAGFPTSDNRIDGALNLPKHFTNLTLRWNRGPWSANYGLNFQSSQTFGGPSEPFGIQDIEEDPFLLDRPRTGSGFVHFLGGAYNLNDKYQFSVRVSNLFDRDPFELRGFGNAPRPVNFLGRTVQLGVQANF
ncbi:MAG: TonB-dependent receptor [Pseudomonadota bacterium]